MRGGRKNTLWKRRFCIGVWVNIGRSERIRTSGPCLPKTVLYQAELHSDRRRGIRPRPLLFQGSIVLVFPSYRAPQELANPWNCPGFKPRARAQNRSVFRRAWTAFAQDDVNARCNDYARTNGSP